MLLRPTHDALKSNTASTMSSRPGKIRPIFVGGCHRSGTTLLGAMLGASKESLVVPESQFKIDVLGNLGLPQDAADVQAAWNKIKKHWRFRMSWVKSLEATETPDRDAYGSYTRLIEWVVTKYGQYIGMKDFSVWVDHTPNNVRHLSTLLSIFPEAKAIHIVRDGRAVAASAMPTRIGPSSIIGAAHWWVHNVSYGLAAESALGRDRITRVKYEDLVIGPEKVMKGLCSWLGIDYHPDMAKGGGHRPEFLRGNYNLLVGKEPDPTRTIAWERELKPRQIEVFESRAKDFLLYLGYGLKYGARARKAGAREMITSMLVELNMGVVNIIRAKRHRARHSK